MKQKLLMLDDLFTTQAERDEMKLEKIRDIQIKDIEDFPNHPFKINKGEEIENMKESISQNGILVPALVRQKEDGKYEMIAGHRRKFAAMLLGMETIPCIVRELSDDEAKANWEKWVEVNSNDGYSYGVVKYARRWAKYMQHLMKKHNKTLPEIADNASHVSDTEGITGFMYGGAVAALSQFWKYGEELRRRHNKEWGQEDTDGVVNPDVLTINVG